MSLAFLPSDRWGKNLSQYTSDTKKREYFTSIVSIGALGCAAFIFASVAFAWLFPSVGEPLLASAGQLSEDVQGLRQQNALLRAHLQRLSQAQEVLLQSESEERGRTNHTHVLVVNNLRRLLLHSSSLLEEEAVSDGAGLHPPTHGLFQDLHAPSSKQPLEPLQDDLGMASSLPRWGGGAGGHPRLGGSRQPRNMQPASQAQSSTEEWMHTAMRTLGAASRLVPLLQGMAHGIREIARDAWDLAFGSEGLHYLKRKSNSVKTRSTPTAWRKKAAKQAKKQKQHQKVARKRAGTGPRKWTPKRGRKRL